MLTLPKGEQDATAQLRLARIKPGGKSAKIPAAEVDGQWQATIPATYTSAADWSPYFPFVVVSYQWEVVDGNGKSFFSNAMTFRVWRPIDIDRPPSYAEQALDKVERVLLELGDTAVTATTAIGVQVVTERRKALEAHRADLITQVNSETAAYTDAEQDDDGDDSLWES